MPYYQRGSVGRLISDRYMTVREIVTIGGQVLSGLHNIHSKGLIHFDVKPDNILLSDRGEGLLSDFGLTKHMNLMGRAGQDRLYPKTIPPEAIGRDQFERTFDIYQFGLTLYRMCNSNELFYQQLNAYGIDPAFDQESFHFDLRNGRFPDRDAFVSHIPTRLRNIIKTCLEPTTTDRYQSAIDVANALAEVDGATLDWQFTMTGGRRT
jgi:serine/threonine protein kinase